MDKLTNLKVIRVNKHDKTNSDPTAYYPQLTINRNKNISKILKTSASNKKIKHNSSYFSIRDILQTDINSYRLVEFDQYGKQIGGLMSEYKLDSTHNLLNKIGSSMEDSFKNSKNISHQKSKSFAKNQEDKSNINICVNTEEYKNHSDAVLIIKKNKIIHDNLVKTFFERQTQKYADTYREIDHSNIKSKLRKIANSKAKIFSSNLANFTQEKGMDVIY